MKAIGLLSAMVAVAAGTVMASEARAAQFVGDVVSVNTTAGTLVVQNDTGSKTFTLEKGVSIFEEGGHKVFEFDRLTRGDHVKILYKEAGDKLLASKLVRMPVKQATKNNKPKH